MGIPRKVDNVDRSFIRRRVEQLFKGQNIDGQVLVTNIAFAAAAIGSGHVELVNHKDWWFVASEFDWMEPKPPLFELSRQLFEGFVPCPELGPTSVRPEIYIAPYCTRAYIDRNGYFEHVLGGEIPHPRPHIGVTPPWCVFVLGFEVLANG